MIVLSFLLACWGATHILVKGKILNDFRNWLIIKSSFFEGVLTCHQCCGFWVGCFLSLLTSGLPDCFLPFIDIIIWGCVSSGFCSIVNGVIFYLFSSDKKG
jgi:hypothetical protein